MSFGKLGKLDRFVHKNFTLLVFVIRLTLTEKGHIIVLAVWLTTYRLIDRRCHNG